MKNEIEIINNKYFKIFKENNKYSFNCNIKNEKIYLNEIINLELIKTLFDLNKDIFQETSIEKIDNENVNIIIIFKHLFKELGLTQKYTYISLKKNIIDDKIIIIGTPIKNINKNINNIELLDFNKTQLTFNNIQEHEMNCFIEFDLDIEENIPQYIVNIIIMIWSKMFNRLKEFIENIVII